MVRGPRNAQIGSASMPVCDAAMRHGPSRMRRCRGAMRSWRCAMRDRGGEVPDTASVGAVGLPPPGGGHVIGTQCPTRGMSASDGKSALSLIGDRVTV